MMNEKTKRNLKKVVVVSMMTLTLATIGASTAQAKTDPPVIFSVEKPSK
jgi:hypothetical protein